MSITQAVQEAVKAMEPGKVFGYEAIPEYAQAPGSVVKAISRLVSSNQIERLSKGKFYVPKQGMLGPRKPSDNELIRSVLFKKGRLRGYVTGPALFNNLGLTTQMPVTITIALNGGRMEKQFGTIRIKLISARAPVTKENVTALQFLDVLKDIKHISDTRIDRSLTVMKSKIEELNKYQLDQLVGLAVEYYGAQVRALLGLIISATGQSASEELKESLNPVTSYNLNLNQSLWPDAKDWNIH